ncbi:MAG: hypothetical protein IJ399_02865 [Bacilli bacterium]|nr:hypothetical protein [Bacilli bacterium]
MKEVKYSLKLKLPARKATPAPPVAIALGPSKININKFCDDFNNWSKDLHGVVEFGVIIYNDLSYDILSKEEFKRYEISQINESLSFLYREQNEKSVKRR